MTLRTLALAALHAVLAGCSVPEPLEPEPSAPETLGFTMKSQERTYGDCVAGTEGCTYARLDYPVLTDVPQGAGPLAEAVTTEVREFVFAPVFEPEPPAEAAPAEPDAAAEPAEPLPERTPPTNPVDELVAAFAAFKETEPRYQGSWSLERKAFVLLDTETVLSLSFLERRYTGGAHGLETVRLMSLDATTGERLRLDDVIEPARRPELETLAEARFREAREIPPEASLEQAGFTFEEGAFTLTENFAVQEDGLVFYFNPYEIAPYALGPTEIELGWAELDGLVDSRFRDSG